LLALTYQLTEAKTRPWRRPGYCSVSGQQDQGRTCLWPHDSKEDYRFRQNNNRNADVNRSSATA